MILKHVARQIKATLMKDRHQSATSLERLRGMTWLSRSRNMVTHPALISPSQRIDWTFAYIHLPGFHCRSNEQSDHRYTSEPNYSSSFFRVEDGKSGSKSGRYSEPLTVEGRDLPGGVKKGLMTVVLIYRHMQSSSLTASARITSRTCLVHWNMVQFQPISWNLEWLGIEGFVSWQ